MLAEWEGLELVFGYWMILDSILFPLQLEFGMSVVNDSPVKVKVYVYGSTSSDYYFTFLVPPIT